jgi:hypothetical protein
LEKKKVSWAAMLENDAEDDEEDDYSSEEEG